jgi:cytochrome c-type biogenesis protein CcmH/NrfG
MMYREIEVDTVKAMIREREQEEARAEREAAVLARIKEEKDEATPSTLDEAKGVALGLVIVAELTLLAAVL